MTKHEDSTTLNGVALTDLLDSMIPDGWKFNTCDASTDRILVMLKRDNDGTKWWHSLPEQTQEITALYASGRGKTFGEAVAEAAEFVRDGCGI